MTQSRGPILDAPKARYTELALILNHGYVNEDLNHGLTLNFLNSGQWI